MQNPHVEQKQTSFRLFSGHCCPLKLKSRLIGVQDRITHGLMKNVEVKNCSRMPPYKIPNPAMPAGVFKLFKALRLFEVHGALFYARGTSQSQLSHSENLQSLPMSYHFGYAKAYAMLTRVEFFLTRSKLRKPLREVLTRPYASEGFAYAKHVMTL